MVFTTSDYFPLLLRQFHWETGWDDSNSYATLCRASKAMLDFRIPHGLSVGIGRNVSSHLNSQLVFAMVPSTASSIGYLSASRPLLATTAAMASRLAPEDLAWLGSSPLSKSDIVSGPDSGAVSAKPPEQLQSRQEIQDVLDSRDLLQSIRAGAWRCNWNALATGSAQSPGGDYLLVAQMYPSLSSITGSYVVRRSQTSEMSVSGVSVAGAHPDLQFIFQHALNQRRWSSEATFGTSGKVFGLRGQYSFGDVAALDAAAQAYHCSGDDAAKRAVLDYVHGRLSVGGEVYFGAQEASGGMSLGLRYRYDQPLLSELTCTVNPIMGHMSLAWTQQLRDRVCAAARYDFNAFSLVSELAAGLEWQLDRSSVIKARWSDSQGLRCLVDARLNNVVLSMGLDLGGGAAPSGIRRLVRSFGFQFQWFL
ncbi:Mitochondrial distribution and morphology protein 10 [Coemansia sp. RSA 552]|nr:Mitochondrial distribution and morphology protein 10 [Coemansia sp. RSA 552]